MFTATPNMISSFTLIFHPDTELFEQFAQHLAGTAEADQSRSKVPPSFGAGGMHERWF